MLQQVQTITLKKAIQNGLGKLRTTFNKMLSNTVRRSALDGKLVCSTTKINISRKMTKQFIGI